MDDSVLKHEALALWTKGQRHQLRGDIERAIELYTKSLALYPTAEAYTFRGWAYSFQGRLDDAIDECKKAIAVDPDLRQPVQRHWILPPQEGPARPGDRVA